MEINFNSTAKMFNEKRYSHRKCGSHKRKRPLRMHSSAFTYRKWVRVENIPIETTRWKLFIQPHIDINQRLEFALKKSC